MQSELKEDVTGMNKVHERATGVANYYSSYSLKDLQNERRWEFACEGIRWNDIRRWHIAQVALAKQENQDVYYCGNPGRTQLIMVVMQLVIMLLLVSRKCLKLRWLWVRLSRMTVGLLLMQSTLVGNQQCRILKIELQ